MERWRLWEEKVMTAFFHPISSGRSRPSQMAPKVITSMKELASDSAPVLIYG